RIGAHVQDVRVRRVTDDGGYGPGEPREDPSRAAVVTSIETFVRACPYHVGPRRIAEERSGTNWLDRFPRVLRGASPVEMEQRAGEQISVGSLLRPEGVNAFVDAIQALIEGRPGLPRVETSRQCSRRIAETGIESRRTRRIGSYHEGSRGIGRRQGEV